MAGNPKVFGGDEENVLEIIQVAKDDAIEEIRLQRNNALAQISVRFDDAVNDAYAQINIHLADAVAKISPQRDDAIAQINIRRNEAVQQIGYLKCSLHLQIINQKNAALQSIGQHNAAVVIEMNDRLGVTLLEFQDLSAATNVEFRRLNFEATLQLINQRNASLQSFAQLKETAIWQLNTDWNLAMQQLNANWTDVLQAFGNMTLTANTGFTALVNNGLLALQQTAHTTNLATQQAIIAQQQAVGLGRRGFGLRDHLVTAGFALLVLYKIQNVDNKVQNVGEEVRSLRNDVTSRFSESVFKRIRSGCEELFKPILPVVDACKEMLLNTALKGFVLPGMHFASQSSTKPGTKFPG